MAHQPGHKFKSPSEFELGGYKGLYSSDRERIRAERVSGKHILEGIERIQNMTRREIHIALASAGIVPGYGIGADLVDMVLYALEGEKGMATLSGVSAIPGIGQIAGVKKITAAAGTAASGTRVVGEVSEKVNKTVKEVVDNYKELRAIENQSDYIGNVMIRFWRATPNLTASNIIRNVDNGNGLEKTVVGGEYNKHIGYIGNKKQYSDSRWMPKKSHFEGPPFARHYGFDDAGVVGQPIADAIKRQKAYEGLSTQVWTSTNPRYVMPFAKYGTSGTLKGKEGIIMGFDVTLSQLARWRNIYIQRSVYNMNRPGFITNDHIVRKVIGMPPVADIKSFKTGRGYYRGGGVTDPSITRFEIGVPKKSIARVYYGGQDDFLNIPELGAVSQAQFSFNPRLPTTEWVGGINTYNNAPILRGLKRYGGWDGIRKAFSKEFGTMEDITKSYR
jgi:hypothetical protein